MSIMFTLSLPLILWSFVRRNIHEQYESNSMFIQYIAYNTDWRHCNR